MWTLILQKVEVCVMVIWVQSVLDHGNSKCKGLGDGGRQLQDTAWRQRGEGRDESRGGKKWVTERKRLRMKHILRSLVGQILILAFTLTGMESYQRHFN